MRKSRNISTSLSSKQFWRPLYADVYQLVNVPTQLGQAEPCSSKDHLRYILDQAEISTVQVFLIVQRSPSSSEAQPSIIRQQDDNAARIPILSLMIFGRHFASSSAVQFSTVPIGFLDTINQPILHTIWSNLTRSGPLTP